MRVRVTAGVVVIELHGELDILTEHRLTARIDKLTCLGRSAVVMDLSGVTFMDASGLRLLLRTRNRVLARGGTLQVVPDSRWVAKVLRLIGTGFGLPLLKTLPSELGGDSLPESGGALA
jgi:anti-anti-sigma factor